MVKEYKYSKALFWMVISIMILLVSSSILYVSIQGNYSVKEDAPQPIMAWLWIIWIYIVPTLAIISSLIYIIFGTWTNLTE